MKKAYVININCSAADIINLIQSMNRAQPIQYAVIGKSLLKTHSDKLFLLTEKGEHNGKRFNVWTEIKSAVEWLKHTK